MNKLVLTLSVLLCMPTLIKAQIDTNTVVYSWKLDEYFANHLRVPVDTTLDNFQNQNPVFRNYTSVSTLGNYSEPSESNVFVERDRQEEFMLINPFFPYMKRFTNTTYINTRKPFTKISYFRGGSSQNKEELLDAFHSQNLTKTLNVGLHYTTVGSLGQYRFQNVKNNSFNFFSSLTGINYSYHTSFNLNKIIADENGGILNDTLVGNPTFQFTKDIPTLFGGVDNPPHHTPDVYTEVRNMNLFTMQEIAFRRNKTNADSLSHPKKLRIFYPKLIYIFYIDRSVRLFKDKVDSTGYKAGLYPALLFNNISTSDSMVYWKIFNSARLQFQGKRSNHYFVDYTYELLNYTLIAPPQNPKDSLPRQWFISEKIVLPGITIKNRLFNAYASSGFNKVFANHVELNLFGRLYLSGYRASDFYLKGDLRLFTGKAGKLNSILFRASNELRTPDFLYTHYASNNFLWTRNFSQTSFNSLSIDLSVSSKKFDIQGDYVLIHNLVYFNEASLPEQDHAGLSIFTVSAFKRFDFWKISSTSKIVYQKTDDQQVLGLPEIVLYNSTFLTQMINFKATGGKLLTMIGFDLFYNSKYYADAYMPALTTFYRQSEKQLGNHPYFDPFLNVQLKRFRFYIKYEHVNSGWSDKNYFSVLHYPRNERNIKFGLSWTFYD
jgi:hypothetical protein